MKDAARVLNWLVSGGHPRLSQLVEFKSMIRTQEVLEAEQKHSLLKWFAERKT